MNTDELRNHFTILKANYCRCCGKICWYQSLEGQNKVVDIPCKTWSFTYEFSIGFNEKKQKFSPDFVFGYCYYRGNPELVYKIRYACMTRRFYIGDFEFMDYELHEGAQPCIKIADYIDKMSTAFTKDFWQYDCSFVYNTPYSGSN